MRADPLLRSALVEHRAHQRRVTEAVAGAESLREPSRSELAVHHIVKHTIKGRRVGGAIHDREIVRIEPVLLLAKLGPSLLATLEALGLTPRARAAIMAKGGRNERDSGAEHAADCKCLPCQRKRRAVRRDRAAPMDPAAG